MRGVVPGDPGSLSAIGAASRRAARDLAAARETSGTAYASLKDTWATSTSVRTRKEGQRALATLAEGDAPVGDGGSAGLADPVATDRP